MVMMIGFVTMGALVTMLAFCMAKESDAEKRWKVSPIDGVPTAA